jgi:hypothetical protein
MPTAYFQVELSYALVRNAALPAELCRLIDVSAAPQQRLWEVHVVRCTRSRSGILHQELLHGEPASGQANHHLRWKALSILRRAGDG